MIRPNSPRLSHAVCASLLAVGFGLVFSPGCGHSQPGTTETTAASPSDPVASNPGDPGAPVASPGGGDCSQEIALVCPTGTVDGCLAAHPEGGNKRLTSYHICASKSGAAAAPCAQEIARQCEDGMIDACLVNPPASDMHICVKAR